MPSIPDDLWMPSRRAMLTGLGAGAATVLAPSLAVAQEGPGLWRRAWPSGLVYGSSAATWQLGDDEYARVVSREAAIVLTEDDLLWYRLKPTPRAELDFTYGDELVAWAEQRGMLVLGAHLVWDEGFGEGWSADDLFGIEERRARRLLFGTLEQTVARYRGRVAGWIVVNEAIDGWDHIGLRTDVPWYDTIGPSYVAEAFHLARATDPDATLVLNEFGYETDNEYGDRAADKRRATLLVLDELLAAGVPVDALGVQAHLQAAWFRQRFDAPAYRRFLREVADRGLQILITELDVLDDGLPADVRVRDRAVADVYARYLDVALDEPAVKSLLNFGLSDRYTWLEEDDPRADGEPRRPLPFDEELARKPAYSAVSGALSAASERGRLWVPPRAT